MDDTEQVSSSPPRHDVDVVLAGSTLEGGGGLIRDALTYSTILNRSIRIESIRCGRPGSQGLRSEHTVAISTISNLCNASVEGNITGSKTLTFLPYRLEPQEKVQQVHRLELDLAGSSSISLIALLPLILFSRLSSAKEALCHIPANGVDLIIRGGTLCVKAPSYHYLVQVLFPTLHMIGLACHVKLADEHVQGWHTASVQSPGMIRARIKPVEKPFQAFHLPGRGTVFKILATGTVPSSSVALFETVLKRELEAVFLSTKKQYAEVGTVLVIKVETSNQPNQYHLLLAAHTKAPEAYLGYDQVYPQLNPAFPPELEYDEELKLTRLARVCIKGLVEELKTGSAVDDHMADIITPYQALAVGRSVIALRNEEAAMSDIDKFQMGDIDGRYHLETSSLHKETSHWVARKLAGVEFVRSQGDESCVGIGLGLGASRSSC